MEQYARVLQDSSMEFVNVESKTRIRQLLGLLVNQSLHHRDIVEGAYISFCNMININVISENGGVTCCNT